MARQEKDQILAQESELMRRLGEQLGALQDMGLRELREQHLELYGTEAKSKNLPFLRKKLAFRLQERVEGGLSPEAMARIEDLAPKELPVKVRLNEDGTAVPMLPQPDLSPRDPRLPEAGTILRREHKGFEHEVEVMEQGFRYRGRGYTSLSSIAKEITGVAWNGYTFFGLKTRVTHG